MDLDLDRRLRAAGEAPVPPPDPAFAARLEERLRAGTLAPEPVLRPAGPGRSLARRWYPVLGMAAAVAAVLGAVGVLRDPGPGRVRVTTPATAPAELPEPPAETTTTTAAVVTPKPSVTTSTTVKVTTTTSTTKATTRPTTKTTTQPTTKTTIQPVEPKPTTTTTSGPTAGVAALRLESRYRDTTAKLQWSNYAGKDFAAYLVLRADGPAEPTYPADDATTVVATITGQWSVSYMETITDPTSRRYRVVAVDGDGHLVAVSPVVTPQAF